MTDLKPLDHKFKPLDDKFPLQRQLGIAAAPVVLINLFTPAPVPEGRRPRLLHGLVKSESKRGNVMTEQNAYQVADWNGQSGEYWVANQARLDAMFAVFGQAAIEAAAPTTGERVLDVGCGAGASSLALAARVGAGGHVLGVDISEPLIGRACALAPQDTPAQFRVADASSAELPERAFDILFSRFGVMFFDDPAGAFSHMRWALRPGGRVAFVCWRGAAENDWVRLPLGRSARRIWEKAPAGSSKNITPKRENRMSNPPPGSSALPASATWNSTGASCGASARARSISGSDMSTPNTWPPAPPDPEAPGPFSFGDRGRVARILTAAGFTDIAIAPFDASVPFGEGGTRDAAIDDAVKMALEVGPLSRVLVDQPDDIRDRASAAVRAVFAGLPGERSVMMDGAAWIVTARNPAS